MSYKVDAVSGEKVFPNPSEMFKHVTAITAAAPKKTVRNFHGEIADMSEKALVVETELFPRDALHFYTRYNLDILDLEGNAEDAAAHTKYYTPARGGGQGDYRKGMKEKIDNVVDCLTKYPHSKRAVITIVNAACLDHSIDDQAKCLRELHFYLDDDSKRLCCTGLMRAQAATIFPKNIHYIGTLMHEVARRLKGVAVGSYHHMVTTLVDGRES